MIWIQAGAGYWLQPHSNHELQAGTSLLLPPESQGAIRASQVSELSLRFFRVEPGRLSGLLTLNEQQFFARAATEENVQRSFEPDGPVSLRLTKLCAPSKRDDAHLRLKLLETFIDAFGNRLSQVATPEEPAADATQRLKEFLERTPAAELLNLGFPELAQMTRCTPRHLSRIFHETVGMSFRDKQAELRLARARELLATSESKVVDISLESGYQSLSLFNSMFKRRFGLSPGKWRQQLKERKISRKPLHWRQALPA